ncbi:uncharacterized protein LOC141829651 isoform X2 [Curcuma longa]|uniref:uncharacterized protein LOC141829651 isoform X2 n=1 Tax=Curcuma longa TaxID=136217 RepID=UPI003D9F357E
MADHQFQAGSSWWSSSAVPCRPDDVVSLPAMPSFVSCSTVLCRSLDYCDEMTTSPSASVSNSSVTFQGHPSALTTAGVIPMDHFPSHEWNLQGPFCSGARSEHNFHGLLQEDVMTISGVNIDMDGSSFSSTTNINPLRSHPMSHTFLEDHSDSFIINPLVSPSFASPYAFLHGLNLEQDGGSQTSFEEDRTIRLPEQQQQLQFSNETFFWNPIAASGTEHHALRPPAPPPPPPLTLPLHNQTSSGGYNSSLLKTSSNSSMESRKSSEPSLKKTRIEAPSVIPTFKVRKEKLGDRITALQQLVSPFGKTDTASVLHEAIEYIKFLHNQVLSAPYLKNGHPAVPQMKDSEKSKECVVQNQELRSRGLCLVPISSTFAVANEIPTDFWTPTFMGGAFT